MIAEAGCTSTENCPRIVRAHDCGRGLSEPYESRHELSAMTVLRTRDGLKANAHKRFRRRKSTVQQQVGLFWASVSASVAY